MLEKFRELSFNKKIAVTLSLLTITVVILIVIGVAIKALTQTSDEKPNSNNVKPTETSVPSSSITIPPPSEEITDGTPSDANKTYGSFTTAEVNDFTAQASIASAKFCSKNAGETQATLIDRAKNYFIDYKSFINYLPSDSILERKCFFESYNAISVDTIKNTVDVKVEGFSHTINADQASLPEAERQKEINKTTYILTMVKDADGQIKILKVS